MRTILLSSSNRGKVAEITAILGPALQAIDAELKLPADVGILDWDVEETGATFAENAVLKARALADRSGLVAVADDSGLCVDALGGEPGVRSARWLGASATDIDRNTALLDRLRTVGLQDRTAQFVCVAAIAWPAGSEHVEMGTLEGVIALEPAGRNGFGYDPIFCPTVSVDGTGDRGGNAHGTLVSQKTLAELSADQKNRISHRRNAFEKLAKIFSQIAVGEAHNI